MRRIALTINGLAAVLLLALPVTSSTAADAQSKGEPAQVAAPDFTALSLNGPGTAKLSDFKGQVVLLNFWASWCFPCRYEMPHFQKIHDTLKDDGLAVVAVAVFDKLEEAQAFQDKYGFTFPILFDKSGKAKDAFSVDAVPWTYLVQRDGTLARIRNPKTNKELYRVNDPTIWENPQTVSFLREVLTR